MSGLTKSQNDYFALFKTEFKFGGIPCTPDLMSKMLFENSILAITNYLGKPFIGPFMVTERNAYGEPARIAMRSLWSGRISFSRSEGDFVLLDMSVGDKSPRDAISEKLQLVDDIDLAIRLNVYIHQMPNYMLVNDKDVRDELREVMSNIRKDGGAYLGNIVLDEGSDLVSAIKSIEVIKADAPYIIDKLQSAKSQVKSDILSLLGINYNAIQKNSNMVVDEVNANSLTSSMIYNHMTYTLKKAFSDANALYNWAKPLTAEPTMEPAEPQPAKEETANVRGNPADETNPK